MISSEKNRLHKILDSAGCRVGVIVSDIYGVSAQAVINGLIKGEDVEVILSKMKGAVKRKKDLLRQILEQPLAETHKFLLQQILNHIEHMEQQRDALDEKIQEAMEPYKMPWQWMQTIPGVDSWSSAALIAECGVDMQRFGTVEQLCSWAGMCPGNNESAGKRKNGKTRKGNSYIRSILCQLANAAIKTKSQFKEKYKTLAIRRGHKRAIVAIGHKLLKVICCLFTQKKNYEDPGIDYSALVVARNASRWLRALDKYGFQYQVITPQTN